MKRKQPTEMRAAFARAISTKRGQASHLYGKVLHGLKHNKGLKGF